MKKAKKIKSYKGFDKNLKCRDFQYEIGKEYETEKAVACETGFHACENPFDVFSYYRPAESRYCEVEQSGEMDSDTSDSKISSSKIKINFEIGLPGLIKAGIEYILSKVEFDNQKESNTGYQSAATNTGYRSAATNTGYRSAATNTGDQSAATNTGDQSAATNTGNQSAATNTGYRSAATNTGYRSAATNTGDQSAATNTGDQSAATNTGYQSAATNTGNQSAATNTGDYSAATNTGYRSAATNTGNQSAAEVSGKDSIAIVTGYDSKARGTIGNWLVITERDSNYKILCVISVCVDGETVKENTWYKVVNGQLKEA